MALGFGFGFGGGNNLENFWIWEIWWVGQNNRRGENVILSGDFDHGEMIVWGFVIL